MSSEHERKTPPSHEKPVDKDAANWDYPLAQVLDQVLHAEVVSATLLDDILQKARTDREFATRLLDVLLRRDSEGNHFITVNFIFNDSLSETTLTAVKVALAKDKGDEKEAKHSRHFEAWLGLALVLLSWLLGAFATRHDLATIFDAVRQAVSSIFASR